MIGRYLKPLFCLSSKIACQCLRAGKSSKAEADMEVLSPNQDVIPKTNGTNGHCNGTVTLQDVHRFDVHTGNVSHWSSLKRKTTQNPAVEVSGPKQLRMPFDSKACSFACLFLYST